jgi:hypothetical protein
MTSANPLPSYGIIASSFSSKAGSWSEYEYQFGGVMDKR